MNESSSISNHHHHHRHPNNDTTVLPTPAVMLKVVLLCKGRGADASSYRPNRDESQWWCRRDALVRCVAAFLYGPSPSLSSSSSSSANADSNSQGAIGNDKELVLLFDEDLARIHMSLTQQQQHSLHKKKEEPMVPTEQALVSLWKQAALKPKETITYRGLSCRIDVDPLDDNDHNYNNYNSIDHEKDNDGNAGSSRIIESSTLVSKKSSSSTTTTTTTTTTKSLTMPRGLDSKRQVLEYLQHQCSIEFLRLQNLNSRPDTILRKTNKMKLMKVWNQWRQQELAKRKNQTKQLPSQQQQQGRSLDDKELTNIETFMTTTNVSERQQRIESIYTDLLQPPPSLEVEEESSTKSSSSTTTINNTKVVAGTLHEDFEELPCYGNETNMDIRDGDDVDDNNDNNNNDASKTNHHRRLYICLFLGAVRDMYPMEYKALNGACQRLCIPMVGIRLGTVPEFTSKILSILTFHHAQGRLRTAILRLASRKNDAAAAAAAVDSTTNQQETSTTISTRGQPSSSPPPPPPSCLHIIAIIPLSSHQLSTNLKDRNRIHWSLIRLVVCTLWRSKLASSSTSVSSHTNTLTLVLEDGIVVHLSEREFVHALAEQHQAAPCEYQILSALSQKVQSVAQSQPGGAAVEPVSAKKRAVEILKTITTNSPLPVTCMITIDNSGNGNILTALPTSSSTITSNSNNDQLLVHNFYNTESHNNRTDMNPHHHHPHHSVVAVLGIGTNSSTTAGETGEHSSSSSSSNKMVEAFERASTKLDLPVLRQVKLVGTCQDWEAATVVALQHFCYQNRMFPPISSSNSAKKMKKTKKRKHSSK